MVQTAIKGPARKYLTTASFTVLLVPDSQGGKTCEKYFKALDQARSFSQGKQ
jgi:hypothetical protein